MLTNENISGKTDVMKYIEILWSLIRIGSDQFCSVHVSLGAIFGGCVLVQKNIVEQHGSKYRYYIRKAYRSNDKNHMRYRYNDMYTGVQI